jgi:AcrR family transcriptional regulator
MRTRAAILETALELFSRQGYHATTMRQIAVRCSLTPGSIYNHFSGKDDLFLSVLSAYHPLNQISPLLAVAEGDTPEEYVRLLANQIADVLEDQPGLMNLSFIEMVELEGQHLPALVERFQPQVMAFVQRLLLAPERLQVPPLSAFRVFLGLLLAYKVSDRLVQTALGSEGVDSGDLDDFVDVYLYGIVKPAPGGEEEDEHE